jgi:hypothetical protein
VHTLFTTKAEDLPFTERVAAELTRSCDLPCEARLAEDVPPAGGVWLSHRGTSLKKLKTAVDITARFDVVGGAEPMPLKIVLCIENPDAKADDPLALDALASSVAHRIRAIFDERDAPGRKDIVIYSMWCGAPFAEHLARGLGAAGFDCTIRPEHPNTYDHLPRAWGRIVPAALLLSDEIRIRKVTVMLGERGEELGLLKMKSPGGDQDEGLKKLAEKVVAKIVKLVAQQRG